MAIVCPNKNHPDWGVLVNKVGIDEAYFLWNVYDGKVPLEVANNRRKSIIELRKEIGIPYQINESNKPNILKKISNYNTKNQTSHSVNFDKVGQSQRLKVNLIVDFTPYSQQAREERAEMRSEEGKVFTESVQSIKEPVKEGVDFVFESNPELANEVYEALGFKRKQYASKLKELSERRGLATKWDLENSQLMKDIRVDKSQPKELKPNAADNNLTAIMLYGMKMSELQDKGLPEEMNEATTLAYRILNDFMFNIDELSFYEDILLENPEYAATLSTNENPVKDFFENDIFEQVEKEKLEITPQQKQQAQQLYSEYLDTIFPDSKVKDIVYHKTDKIFDKFKKQELAFYFTSSNTDNYTGVKYGQFLPSILNIKNPDKVVNKNNYIRGRDNFQIENNNDGIIMSSFIPDGINWYVVFEPEQIHILGSKQDIKGFKEFVQKSLPIEQKEQLKQKEANLQEYNKVKKAETMEEVKAQMLKDFDSYYPQFKDLLSWEKEMFIDMMSEGEINTYC